MGVMSAFLDAKKVYDLEPCARSFEVDLALHLEFGYVFSTPDAFIMGRPVDKHASYDQIIRPEIEFPSPNAWLIWLAAGAAAIRVFLDREPFPLPYMGWERDNKLRWYDRQQIIRHVTRTNSRRNPVLQGWFSTQTAQAAIASDAFNGS